VVIWVSFREVVRECRLCFCLCLLTSLTSYAQRACQLLPSFTEKLDLILRKRQSRKEVRFTMHRCLSILRYSSRFSRGQRRRTRLTGIQVGNLDRMWELTRAMAPRIRDPLEVPDLIYHLSPRSASRNNHQTIRLRDGLAISKQGEKPTALNGFASIQRPCLRY
jgi:hypothetical protein